MISQHRTLAALGLSLALLSTGVSVALAEDLPPTSRNDPYDAVSRINPGRSIRLLSPQHGDIAGRFLSNSLDSLFMDLHGETRVVPLADIDRLWTRGNSVGPGLGIGSAIGFLAFFAVAGASDSEADGGIGVAMLAGTMGGVLGGAAGSLVGLTVPRWQLQYEAQDHDRMSGPPADVNPTDALPPGAWTGPGQEPSAFLLVELLGGVEVMGDAERLIGGRILIRGTRVVQLGIEIASIQYDVYEDPSRLVSQHRTGVSFLCGPSFNVKGLRPHVLCGVGLFNATSSVEVIEGAFADYEESDTELALQVSPGLRIPLARWALLVEGKYQILAAGEFYDLFSVVGGLSYSF